MEIECLVTGRHKIERQTETPALIRRDSNSPQQPTRERDKRGAETEKETQKL